MQAEIKYLKSIKHQIYGLKEACAIPKKKSTNSVKFRHNDCMKKH